jgi:hypothetical protein
MKSIYQPNNREVFDLGKNCTKIIFHASPSLKIQEFFKKKSKNENATLTLEDGDHTMETTKFSGYIQTIGRYIDINSFNIFSLEIFDDENESAKKISDFLFNLIKETKSQYLKKYSDSRVWKKKIDDFKKLKTNPNIFKENSSGNESDAYDSTSLSSEPSYQVELISREVKKNSENIEEMMVLLKKITS